MRVGVVGIRLSHQEMKLASRISRTRDPPFGSVDDDVVSVSDDGGSDVGCVGRGNCRQR